VGVTVGQAVARREEELRVLVMKREEEVAIAKGEEEIMQAVRNREAEVDAACVKREEVDKQIQWVLARENELKVEGRR
jgi:NIMA (never in mitosis gene a)-related kinase 2